MITRQIGKVLRGKATPFQVFTACLLSCALAFVPGFSAGPALVVFLVLLLFVLNANLGLVVLVGAPAKLASLALLPVSFGVGKALLNGPLEGLFRWAVNAPVLAYFGFEHYATTGGLVLGLSIGAAIGLVIVSLLTAFRRKVAGLQEGSERYRRFTSKGWVKAATFVFVGGGKGKKAYSELLEKKVGNPVRITGLVVSAGVVAGIFFLGKQLAAPYLTSALESGLAEANGATVDLERAELDLRGGRLSLFGLALADPNDLSRDVFRARHLEADINTKDLLRKRLAIDSLVVSEAWSGVTRETPGERVGPPPAPSEVESEPAGDAKTIDDYVRDARVWKERLAQAREWLDRLSKSEEVAAGEKGETLEERLERQARESGYAAVVAEHLIEGAPTLLVSRLVVEGLSVASLGETLLDVRGYNLSTQPRLVDGGPRLEIRARDGSLTADLALDALSTDPAANRLRFEMRGLQVDRVAQSLRVGGQRPIEGGTLDLSLDGGWSGGRVGELDMPLRVLLHDTRITVPGQGSAPVEQFALPIALRGPLDDPRITVDDARLIDALVAAGAERLTRELRSRLDAEVSKAKSELSGQAERALGDLGDKVQEQVGSGLKDEAAKQSKGLLDRFKKGGS
jgi:uncharacterized protein (TIGR03546 family)